MLKSSCNVLTDNVHQSLTQCSFWGSPKSLPNLNHRRNVSVSVSCSSASKRPDLSLSVSTTTNNGVGLIGSGSIGLADRLRLGSLTEDGLSYKENFIVRSYEVGINKTATVETIANLLQEVGCNHAQSVGFSTDGFATTPTMRKLHLIWVTARMHIEIYRYPTWSDVVEIETWCQAEGKIGTRRDFILKDYANGEVIGRATSKWVMMNMDTRKLERVTPEIADEYLIYCPKKLRTPEELVNTHELRSITLDYRRECQHDDVVDSLTTPEPINGSGSGSTSQLIGTNGAPTTTRDEDDSLQFLHLLRLSDVGSEINRGRTEWRRKPQRP
ncbi:Oleoyl-acyl carrier protein thioesterase 2 chloroplastic [Bienertia sinuspersici]